MEYETDDGCIKYINELKPYNFFPPHSLQSATTFFQQQHIFFVSNQNGKKLCLKIMSCAHPIFVSLVLAFLMYHIKKYFLCVFCLIFKSAAVFFLFHATFGIFSLSYVCVLECEWVSEKGDERDSERSWYIYNDYICIWLMDKWFQLKCNDYSCCCTLHYCRVLFASTNITVNVLCREKKTMRFWLHHLPGCVSQRFDISVCELIYNTIMSASARYADKHTELEALSILYLCAPSSRISFKLNGSIIALGVLNVNFVTS